MSVYRFLFLCLLAVTLGLTGPLTRGVSPQKAAAPYAVETTRTAGVAELKTGPSSRCQRGAIAWFACWQHAVPLATSEQTALLTSEKSFEFASAANRGEFKASRIFRPPRLI